MKSFLTAFRFETRSFRNILLVISSIALLDTIIIFLAPDLLMKYISDYWFFGFMAIYVSFISNQNLTFIRTMIAISLYILMLASSLFLRAFLIPVENDSYDSTILTSIGFFMLIGVYFVFRPYLLEWILLPEEVSKPSSDIQTN